MCCFGLKISQNELLQSSIRNPNIVLFKQYILILAANKNDVRISEYNVKESILRFSYEENKILNEDKFIPK